MKKKQIRHGATIVVSNNYILNWLQFEGGTIHSIRTDFEIWRPGEVEMVIEHPDLPVVNEGDALLKITPMYRIVEGRMERLDPSRISKKRNTEDKAI